MNERNSLQYANYRRAINDIRCQNSVDTCADVDQQNNDKYDPADILKEDDIETIQNMPSELLANNKELYDPSEQHSDDYDSDTEYHQETKERNYANIKKKLSEAEDSPKKRLTFDNQLNSSDEEEHMDMYRRIQMQEGNDSSNQSQTQSEGSRPFYEWSAVGVADTDKFQSNTIQNAEDQKNSEPRKKRSRWGEEQPVREPQPLMSINMTSMTPESMTAATTSFGNQHKPTLTTLTRSDPALLSYARDNFGSTNLSEEDWKKCEEHFKINLLYQDMLQKRNEIDRMAKANRYKYEYDSDEDINGGTWEHKLRNAEMEATKVWADALTKQSSGKHHIGDFLPPEELKKFMEQYDSKKMNREPDLSDYKEFKLREDNKGRVSINRFSVLVRNTKISMFDAGFQMLQKLGWKEGQGLGFDGGGIKDPINKYVSSF